MNAQNTDSKIASVLFIFLILILILIASNPIDAQDITPEITAEATPESTEPPDVVIIDITPAPTPVIPPLPPGTDVVIIEDYQPLIEWLLTNADAFLIRATILMVFLSNVIITVFKYILPEKQIDSKTIATAVLTSFAGIFLLSQMAGITEQVESGVSFLTALVGPLTAIFATFGGETALHKLFAWLGVPVLGDKQGRKAMQLVSRDSPDDVRDVPF